MVEDKVRYHLSPHHDGERVDRVIAFFSGLSRSKVSDLISKRLILRNGIPIKKGSEIVHTNDEISMPNLVDEAVEEIASDESIDFEVVEVSACSPLTWQTWVWSGGTLEAHAGLRRNNLFTPKGTHSNTL